MKDDEETPPVHPSSFRLHPSVAALLLAAGESRRMGKPKSLLEWRGQPLLAYQVRQLHQAGVGEVVVVAGHDAGRVRAVAEGAGARVVVNPSYRDGRATSLRVGAEALPPDVETVLILSVDQPRTAAVHRRLIDAHQAAGALITTPLHAGRGGHPILLAGSLLEELRLVTEATEGLRALVRRYDAQRLRVPMDDPSVLLEFNTPAEYAAAVADAEVAP